MIQDMRASRGLLIHQSVSCLRSRRRSRQQKVLVVGWTRNPPTARLTTYGSAPHERRFGSNPLAASLFPARSFWLRSLPITLQHGLKSLRATLMRRLLIWLLRRTRKRRVQHWSAFKLLARIYVQGTEQMAKLDKLTAAMASLTAKLDAHLAADAVTFANLTAQNAALKAEIDSFEAVPDADVEALVAAAQAAEAKL